MRGKLRVRLLVTGWGVVTGAVLLAGTAFARTDGAALVVVALVAGAMAGAIVAVLATRWFDEALGPLTDAARRTQEMADLRHVEVLRRDFVANVSHELRTPVTALLSAAETLELAIDKDPEGARRFLGIIERNATRLRRLIEDLLDLSRIESRALSLRPECFDFEPFAAHIFGLFRDSVDKKKIALVVDSAPKMTLACDRRAIEQVLTNLVDNAVKYCGEGSTIVLRADRDGASARVSVIDDGPGIEPKHIGRLFERFYRVDAGRSREMGGTGLGLSICKHLVEAMAGSIGVSSAVGQGTTFEVRLPDADLRTPDRASSPDLDATDARPLAT